MEGLVEGEAVFQWLLSPVDVETYYDAIHEDAPLLISRPNNRSYFDGLLSKDGAACGVRPDAVPSTLFVRNGSEGLPFATAPSSHFQHPPHTLTHTPAEVDALLRRPGGLQYQRNVDVTAYSATGGERTNRNYNADSEPELVDSAGATFPAAVV